MSLFLTLGFVIKLDHQLLIGFKVKVLRKLKDKYFVLLEQINNKMTLLKAITKNLGKQNIWKNEFLYNQSTSIYSVSFVYIIYWDNNMTQ